MAEKMNYNKIMGMNARNQKGDAMKVVYLEGWTFVKKDSRDTVLKTNTLQEGKKVANVNLVSTLPKSQLKFFFGVEDETVERVYVQCAFWDRAAESIGRYNPTEHQILGVFGTLSTKEYTKKDGTIGKAYVLNAFDFKPVTKKKIDGSSATPPVAPAPAPQGTFNSSFGTTCEDFAEIFDDDDLPF